MPKELLRTDLRSALFDAALALLAENGSESLSLRAVARRAGVSAMAPYRHYPDKAALLASLAAHGFDRLGEMLSQADAAAAGQALIAQAVAYVRFALANPALFRLMFMFKGLGDHCELAEAGERAYGILSARVAADAPPEGDRQALALGAWAFVHGLAVLFLDGLAGERIAGPDEEVTRRVTEAMLGRVS